MTKNDRERRPLRKAKPTSSTIDEFRARHGIARSTYFEWQRKEIGPKVIKIGNIVRITDEAERDWLEMARNGGFQKPEKEESAKERRRRKRTSRREAEQ